MIKSIEREKGCFAKAAEDEPLFVLRAQDFLAPTIVREWIKLARQGGCPADKLEEAERLAMRMEEWHNRKMPD